MPSRTALPPNDLRSPVAVIALVMVLLSPSPRPGRPRSRRGCTQRDSSRFHGGFIFFPARSALFPHPAPGGGAPPPPPPRTKPAGRAPFSHLLVRPPRYRPPPSPPPHIT